MHEIREMEVLRLMHDCLDVGMDGYPRCLCHEQEIQLLS
jgi:hypothetical protein